MKYESFLGSVAQRTSLSSEQADLFTHAILETLAERLTSGESLDLAAQLPKPMKAALRPHTEAAQKFGAEEFVRRVADRTGTTAPQAKDKVRAVFATLGEAVSSGEFDDIMTQLPADFDDMTPMAGAQGKRARRRG